MDIENNNVRMKIPYDPNTPIENIFGQMNDANKYVICLNSSLSDATLVNFGEVLILQIEVFCDDAYTSSNDTKQDETYIII